MHAKRLNVNAIRDAIIANRVKTSDLVSYIFNEFELTCPYGVVVTRPTCKTEVEGSDPDQGVLVLHDFLDTKSGTRFSFSLILNRVPDLVFRNTKSGTRFSFHRSGTRSCKY